MRGHVVELVRRVLDGVPEEDVDGGEQERGEDQRGEDRVEVDVGGQGTLRGRPRGHLLQVDEGCESKIIERASRDKSVIYRLSNACSSCDGVNMIRSSVALK